MDNEFYKVLNKIFFLKIRRKKLLKFQNIQKVTWATEWFDPKAIPNTSPSLFEFLSLNLMRSTGESILKETLLF